MENKKEKFGLFCGDFHCGHLVGLTPPEYQQKFIQNSTTKRNKWYKIAESLWTAFDDILKQLPELDFVVINGDMIDGKGKKSGGTELITSSMHDQSDMAVKVINHIRKYGKPGMKVIATYGTPYHTSSEGDEWENVIKDKAKIDKIGAHEWIDVNGVIFDIKHKIGSSSIPHGRFTALARAGLWNKIWALDEKMQPKADVIIRSHVHYHRGIFSKDQVCMTLPALQGMGSKYGAKECEGTVDWGMVLFRIVDKNDYSWKSYTRKLKTQEAKATVI